MPVRSSIIGSIALTLFLTGCVSDVQELSTTSVTPASSAAPTTQAYTPPLIARQAPIYTPTIVVPQGGTRLSMSAVEGAILRGAGARDQWTVTGKRPGQVDLTVVVRSHRARVKVLYDTNKIVIQLVDSTNLLQSGGRIHRNYNKWIILLQSQIESELAKASGGPLN